MTARTPPPDLPDGQPGLLTLGHGTADAELLGDVLRSADVRALVDVRRLPGSRRHPHVARDELARWLPDLGVAYRWEPRLGGRRRTPDDASPDTWWQVEAFRAYAAHTRTDEFREAMADLLEQAQRERTVVLCSETVWWRCHRRLVADVATLLHDVDVRHLGHDGRLSPHRPAAGARVTDDGLVYDRAEDEASAPA
ncbi:hypothetical protein N866_12795 [Actinotalea ferrariae CF5-4]|uniref:DNA repair protein n=1 Tax=Actinotalea ferrariae CF5-4 TaxID=948458 RepID=A0A021VPP9_9CELL|nr:DUF488 domain-containing protein [Actinotalea ferrariae]EYR62010.1 hypothetical protein N866_12795 [Actinotalea ferrariae CF5-4]